MKEYKVEISNEGMYEEKLWKKIFHSKYLSHNIEDDILYGEVIEKERYSPDNLTRENIEYKNVGFKITDISSDKDLNKILATVIPGGPLGKFTSSILEDKNLDSESFKFVPRFVSDRGYYTILTIDLVLLDKKLYENKLSNTRNSITKVIPGILSEIYDKIVNNKEKNSKEVDYIIEEYKSVLDPYKFADIKNNIKKLDKFKIRLYNGNNIIQHYKERENDTSFESSSIDKKISRIRSSNNFSNYFKNAIIKGKMHELSNIELLDSKNENIFYIKSNFYLEHEGEIENVEIIIILNSFNGDLEFFYTNKEYNQKYKDITMIEVDLSSL